MLQVRLLGNLGPGWAGLLAVAGVLDPRDRSRWSSSLGPRRFIAARAAWAPALALAWAMMLPIRALLAVVSLLAAAMPRAATFIAVVARLGGRIRRVR